MPGSLDLANYQWPERSQTLEENPLLLVFQTSIIYNYLKTYSHSHKLSVAFTLHPKGSFFLQQMETTVEFHTLLKCREKQTMDDCLIYFFIAVRIPYRRKSFICASSARDLDSINIMVECMVAGRHDTGAVPENLTS